MESGFDIKTLKLKHIKKIWENTGLGYLLLKICAKK